MKTIATMLCLAVLVVSGLTAFGMTDFSAVTDAKAENLIQNTPSDFASGDLSNIAIDYNGTLTIDDTRFGAQDSIFAANWTAEGNQASADFGWSVANAGDVNCDGFDDVIVGAYQYSHGEASEGRTFVYLGTPSGLSISPSWTAESDQADAEFGFSVAGAGDVNGDGFDDVIVGAHHYSNGETYEGQAYVYLGSSSGLSAIAAWTAESNVANAYFGASVSCAGDVDGDGFDDVIIGAPGYTNGQSSEGRAYVYLGSPAGPSTTPLWTVESNQVSASYGFSVAGIGDVNGDGCDDIAVGSLFYDNGEIDEGKVFVYYGSSSGLSTTASWTAESNQANAEFGRSVAGAGDVNGDGYDELAVGSPMYDNGENNEGRVFVFLGSSSGLSSTADWTVESNSIDANLGFSVSCAGDVDGNGFDDIIIGAAFYTNGQTSEGKVYVYLGSTSGLSSTPSWSEESNQGYAYYGLSVAGGGDANGDGYDEIATGSYWYDSGESNEGMAFVYYGGPKGVCNQIEWTGESNQASAEFGYSVAGAGDVNGDGFDDVIVGAHY